MNGASSETTNTAPMNAALVVPNEHIAVIEHPFIVKNTAKAIRSLGGDQVLDQSLSNVTPENALELSLRPDHPWAKRTQATNVRSQNVLLKVSVPKRTGRKRKRGSDEPFAFPNEEGPTDSHMNGSQRAHSADSRAQTLIKTLQDNPSSYTITPVGTIKQTYRFRNLPDFQYASSTSPLMTNVASTILTADYKKLKSFAIDPTRGIAPGLDVGPPPVTNLMKVPYNYSYRQNIYTRVTTDATGTQTLTTLNPTTKYVNHVVPLSVPDVPSAAPVPLEPEENLDAKLRECIAKFRAELSTRPVMAKRVQENLVCGASEYNLRRCWPYVGYMFSVGPFRDAIIRFGVDPRKDKNCAMYQTLWFQVPGETGYGRRGLEEEWSGAGAKYLRKVRYPNSVKDSHVFDGEKLYRDGKTWQICDITDPLLRRIIDEAPLREDCDDTTGWFGNGTWSMLKMLMKEKIARLAAGKGRDYDTLLEEIVPTIPPFLTPENMMHVSRSADKEFIRISGLIRTTALQMARNSKKKSASGATASMEPQELVGREYNESLVDDAEEDLEEEGEGGDMDIDENQSEQEEGEEIQDE